MRDDRVRTCVLILAVAACGCGRTETHERYTPTSDAARNSLEAALADWQDGKPTGIIERLQPHATVVDTHRTPGQSLETFEILGEVPGETARCFAVRVKLANPPADEKLRYCVIGIDPLWVFRQEDYDMLAHWDHKMPAPAEDKKDGNGKPESPASAGNVNERKSIE